MYSRELVSMTGDDKIPSTLLPSAQTPRPIAEIYMKRLKQTDIRRTMCRESYDLRRMHSREGRKMIH